MATPYAKSLASERGVQLAYVRGTGPNGRIVAADVLEAPAGQQVASGPAIGTAMHDYEQAFAVATVAARNLADLLGVNLAEVPLDAAAASHPSPGAPLLHAGNLAIFGTIVDGLVALFLAGVAAQCYRIATRSSSPTRG